MADSGKEKATDAKETFEVVQSISKLLNTGLDNETLMLCLKLLESGVNPETLATVVTELRKASVSANTNTESEDK